MEITVIAESGIFTANDVSRLAKANVDAILVVAMAGRTPLLLVRRMRQLLALNGI